MPDPNADNPMPDVKSPTVRKVLAWVSWALLLGGPSLAAYVAMMGAGDLKTALIITLGLLIAVAAAIQGGLRNPLKAGSTGVVLLLGVFALGATSCGPYKIAWSTMDNVLHARDLTDEKLAEKAQAAHDECIKKGAGTMAYLTCIKKHYDIALHWSKHAYPGITSGTRVTSVGVKIAQDKGEKKLDWKKLGMGIGCGISGLGQDWEHYIPDELKVLKAAAEILGVYTCPKTKVGAIADFLGPIGKLIAWLADSLGEPTEKIRQRVLAELKKPTSSKVTSVLKKMEAAMPKPAPSPPPPR